MPTPPSSSWTWVNFERYVMMGSSLLIYLLLSFSLRASFVTSLEAWNKLKMALNLNISYTVFFSLRWGIIWSLTPSRMILLALVSFLVCWANRWGSWGGTIAYLTYSATPLSSNTTVICFFHARKFEAPSKLWFDLSPRTDILLSKELLCSVLQTITLKTILSSCCPSWTDLANTQTLAPTFLHSDSPYFLVHRFPSS